MLARRVGGDPAELGEQVVELQGRPDLDEGAAAQAALVKVVQADRLDPQPADPGGVRGQGHPCRPGAQLVDPWRVDALPLGEDRDQLPVGQGLGDGLERGTVVDPPGGGVRSPMDRDGADARITCAAPGTRQMTSRATNRGILLLAAMVTTGSSKPPPWLTSASTGPSGCGSTRCTSSERYSHAARMRAESATTRSVRVGGADATGGSASAVRGAGSGVMARRPSALGASRPTSASVRIRAAIAAALGKGWNARVDVCGPRAPGFRCG